jgi:hypothetical protein
LEFKDIAKRIRDNTIKKCKPCSKNKLAFMSWTLYDFHRFQVKLLGKWPGKNKTEKFGLLMKKEKNHPFIYHLLIVLLFTVFDLFETLRYIPTILSIDRHLLLIIGSGQLFSVLIII